MIFFIHSQKHRHYETCIFRGFRTSALRRILLRRRQQQRLRNARKSGNPENQRPDHGTGGAGRPVHRHSRNLPLQGGRIRLFRQLHQRQTDDLQRVLHDRTGRRLREQQPGTPSADRSLQHGLLGHSQARGTDSQFARDQQPGHRQGSQSRRHVLQPETLRRRNLQTGL